MAFLIAPDIRFALKTGSKKDIDTLNITTLIEHQPLSSDPVRNFYFLNLMWANFFVGLFYRTLVFKRIWRTGGLLGSRPINLLTGIFEIPYFYYSSMHFLFLSISHLDFLLAKLKQ